MSPGTKKSKTSKPIIYDLRRLTLKDGDILVVKEHVVEPESRKEFMEMIQNTINKHIVVIFVQNLSDIRRLSEHQLKHAGLVKEQDE